MNVLHEMRQVLNQALTQAITAMRAEASPLAEEDEKIAQGWAESGFDEVPDLGDAIKELNDEGYETYEAKLILLRAIQLLQGQLLDALQETVAGEEAE